MKHPLSRCAPSPSLASREGNDTSVRGGPSSVSLTWGAHELMRRTMNH